MISQDVLDQYRAHFANDSRFWWERPRDHYTPLHGVGGATMMELFAATGFSSVTPVAVQFEPDGAFPTLRSQPEEPGAWISPWPARRGGLQSRDRERPGRRSFGCGRARRRRLARASRRPDRLALASAMLPTMSDPVTSSRRRSCLHAVARDGARRGRYFHDDAHWIQMARARRRRRVLRLGYEEALVSRSIPRSRTKMASRPPSRSLVSPMTFAVTTRR